LEVAFLGWLLLIEPAYGAVSITLLGRSAHWLGNQIISYGFGKAVDKLVGADYEVKLSDLKRELEGKLAGSMSVERRRIEEQLALTESQLNTLKELINSDPTPEQLSTLKARLRGEIPRIHAVLADHERRLESLEGRLKSIEDRLDMRPLGRTVSVQVRDFSDGDTSVLRSVMSGARERLAAVLSRDIRVRVVTSDQPSADLVVEGSILRNSVQRLPFSGYGVRTLTVIHSLEVSLRILNPKDHQRYFSRVYREDKKEFFSDGIERNSSDYGIAHELMGKALRTGAQEILAFVFGEETER
jgi:hypothetical protein